MQKSNEQMFESIFSRLGEVMRPINMDEPYNPEENLEIWQCKSCDCDCAGQSATQLCGYCESKLMEDPNDAHDMLLDEADARNSREEAQIEWQNENR